MVGSCLPKNKIASTIRREELKKKMVLNNKY